MRPATVPGYPTYAPDGRKLVFSVGPSGGRRALTNRRGRLYVANADGRRRRAISPVTEACFDPQWSPNGTMIAYNDGCESDRTTIRIVNRDGSGLRKLVPGVASGPEWSPDGRAILFSANMHPKKLPSGWGLFLVDPSGRRLRRIRGNYPNPGLRKWAPDGRKIYFVSRIAGTERLFVMRANGTGVRQLSPAGIDLREYELSPDGRRIAFVGVDADSQDWEIYVMSRDGSGVRQLTANRTWDIEPTWSRDGRTLAFTTHRDGNEEIYVMNPDGSDQTNLTRSSADEWSPVWVPN